MTSAVEPFQNPDNFAKYLLFYFESGTTVFIQALRWLYTGQQPIEYHLADFVQNSKTKKKYYTEEKQSLLELRNKTVQLNELDLTLLYKLIQNVCGLGPCDSITNLWNSRCAPNRQNGLEYLFYTLKTGRNNLAHPSSELKNLTDEDVDRKCDEMKTLLTSIIRKAGQRADIDDQVTNDVVTQVVNDLERIRQKKHAAYLMTPSTKKIILIDFKEWYDEQEAILSDFFDSAERVVGYISKEFKSSICETGDAIQEISEPICQEVEHVINQTSEPLTDGIEKLAKSTVHVVSQISNVFFRR